MTMKPDELIAQIKGFKAPSKQQKMLMVLYAKADRSKDEDRKYEAILKAELAARKALTARAKVTKIFRSEEKALAVEQRKARNHRLIQQGILIDLAGLEGRSRGELLGALLAVHESKPEAWASWKPRGDKLLADKEAKGNE